jgi:hypothetical protein
VSASKIPLKIPPSTKDHLSSKETAMNTLASKLTALAAALVMNTVVLGTLGFLFALQS